MENRRDISGVRLWILTLQRADSEFKNNGPVHFHSFLILRNECSAQMGRLNDNKQQTFQVTGFEGLPPLVAPVLWVVR